MTEKPDLHTLLRETRALTALLRKDLDEIAARSITAIQRASALEHVERLATALDDIRHRLGKVETAETGEDEDDAMPHAVEGISEQGIGISDRIDAKAAAARGGRRHSELGAEAPRPPASDSAGADEG